MTTPPPGTYQLGDGGRLTVFEPISATNPPSGSENWPTANLTESSRLTLLPPLAAGATEHRAEVAALSRRLAETLAAATPDERAELLAEITRVLATAG